MSSKGGSQIVTHLIGILETIKYNFRINNVKLSSKMNIPVYISGSSPGFGWGGARNFFFQIWKIACREATCCAWQSHALC